MQKKIKRISQIEGLRAYLAFWVVLSHVIGTSGYSLSRWYGLTKVMRSGRYAVDMFIIISGFVIFYLLDNKKERYLTFITRRFFRIWPLFIILFFISIPITALRISNIEELSSLYRSVSTEILPIFYYWLQDIWINIALHIPMLHGIVPQKIIPYGPAAFLDQAWSISLEWQFYLIAPFVFSYITKSSRSRVAIASILTALIFVTARKIPHVMFGAFLPMHIEFFYLGCLSYFAFKSLSHVQFKIRLLPIGFVIAVILFFTADKSMKVVPLSLWIIFFSQLIDAANPENCDYTKAFSWLFDNKVAQYLGKISYGIYLSHFIIIALIQKMILLYLPTVSQKTHCITLGILTFTATIIVSVILYYGIETRGIRLGRRITDFFENRRA